MELTDATVKPQTFTCPNCGAVSYNRMDIIEQYCGACHTFPEDREGGKHG